MPSRSAKSTCYSGLRVKGSRGAGTRSVWHCHCHTERGAGTRSVWHCHCHTERGAGTKSVWHCHCHTERGHKGSTRCRG
eukprot:365039-Chlamydomonas_euryale.AAC.2